jgi:uncharacterized delta-60 repeat protein
MIVAAGERANPADWGANTHDFALARYNTDGSLDHTFSGDGMLLTDFGGADSGQGVAIQSNGRIVVSGSTCSGGICKLAVARYSGIGGLDSSFSGTGKKVLAYGSGGNGGAAVAIQADGKIVIVGYMKNGSGDFDFAVYRLNPDGSQDGTFSADGRVTIGFGPGRQDTGRDLRLQGGKIVVGGSTCAHDFSSCNFAVARLKSNGSLDTTFSGDGKQTTDFGANDQGYGLAVQADGKIVVAGVKMISSTNTQMALARYTTSGALDTTFGSAGRKVVTFGTRAAADGVLVQADGKIVVGGHGYNGTNFDFALLRLNPNGTADASFSGDGKATVNFGRHDQAMSLLRQGDGKYVLGGLTFGATPNDFALARVLP